MKKLSIYFCIISLAGLMLTTLAYAEAVTPGEEDYQQYIANFHTDIEVQPDSSVRITETINYDFAYSKQHGIIRDIPVTSAPGTFNLMTVRDISVVDEEGNPYMYEVSGNTGPQWWSKFFPRLATQAGVATIKIGDPRSYVMGPYTYVISYTVENALGYFDDRTEIYWNTTGHSWLVPIKEATANVTLPGDQTATLIPQSYCGFVGETFSCEARKAVYNEALDQTTITFLAPDSLASERGMTVAVGFPKGLVAAPGVQSRVLHYLALYFGFLGIPFLVYYWFRVPLRKWSARRRYYQNNPIVAEFDAGDLDPLQVAGIINGKIKSRDISAQIIYLAIKGYIKISKNENEYSFLSTDKPLDTLNAHNQALLGAIKDEDTVSLKSIFFRSVSTIMKGGIDSLSQAGYLNPKRNYNSTTALWGVFLSVNPGIFIWLLLGEQAGIAFSGACISIALLSLIFQPRSYSLLPAGLEEERKLFGLKKYIDVAEDERIKFHNAPEKTVELFESLLPYAMVFGLEKKWAAEFSDIYTAPPSWYDGSVSGSFTSGEFANSISSFSNKVTMRSSVFLSPAGSTFGSSGSFSGSSGGGFSGGGGGGGGGRSW